jgi:hypothetical protein
MPLRLVRNIPSFLPASAYARVWNALNIVDASSFIPNNISHMKRLTSSMRRKKYRLLVGVADVMGSRRSPCMSSSLNDVRYLTSL